MTRSYILPAWGQILRGRRPLLSIEITKECPLRCPGCYAYESNHVSLGVGLQQLADYHGQDLVDRVLELVRRYQPLHISIVGGEFLARHRELDILLPALDAMGIEVQLVTSAFRPVPTHWRNLAGLHVVVSIDGLEITAHCTITHPLLSRPGYLRKFCEFWSARPGTRKIWFSLFTPRKTNRARSGFPPRIASIPFPKLWNSGPNTPSSICSADLATAISPCQFGGRSAQNAGASLLRGWPRSEDTSLLDSSRFRLFSVSQETLVRVLGQCSHGLEMKLPYNFKAQRHRVLIVSKRK